MSSEDRREILEGVADTGVLSTRATGLLGGGRLADLLDGWLAARDDSELALTAWRRSPGRAAYSVYRAAEDRADAAQDALAAAVRLQRLGRFEPSPGGTRRTPTLEDAALPDAAEDMTLHERREPPARRAGPASPGRLRSVLGFTPLRWL
jgi:hypothetical protein